MTFLKLMSLIIIVGFLDRKLWLSPTFNTRHDGSQSIRKQNNHIKALSYREVDLTVKKSITKQLKYTNKIK